MANSGRLMKVEEDEPEVGKYSTPTQICTMPLRKRYMGEFDSQTIAAVTARLPKELFYQYNPSCLEKPSARVLPLLFRQLRDEQTIHAYSLDKNPELAKHWQMFVRALPKSDKPLTPIPSGRNFHIAHYHVVLVKPTYVSWKRKKVRH
ncbi:uncharacterized protein [Rhodnius prolixus]|uniref:uncharacterized protein n=1 Tax=Rhodnius prolixus TaxID=13249 RepID=UPI003D18DF6E